MCMGEPYKKRKQQEIKSAAKRRGYVTVYKVVWKDQACFRSAVFRDRHKPGIQKVRYLNEPESGWHGFLDLKSAERYRRARLAPYTYKILRCKAKAEWIIDCGEKDSMKTILLSRLCFPKFPDTRVTVREFRERCKSQRS